MPSLFQEADELLPNVRDADGALLTQNFLAICRLILPVIGACVDRRWW